MIEYYVFDDCGNLIAIVHSKDRAQEIAEREDGYYRLEERPSEKEMEKMKDEKINVVVYDTADEVANYFKLTPDQLRLLLYLEENDFLHDSYFVEKDFEFKTI